MSAKDFAAREGLQPNTLKWWSYELRRDTRAQHGAIVPIEIAVPPSARVAAPIEIAIDDVTVRCAVGAEVTYVAELVRALRGE